MNKRTRLREYWGLFCLGAVGYSLLEILWRGYTHWTMGVTGGLCLSTLYRISGAVQGWGTGARCALGSAIITAYELVVGCLVNLKLGWDVWDYSQLPFHFRGQICLLYSTIWFLLSMPIFGLCYLLKQHHR
ncbi:MAG: hypothetical protein HFF11_02225 [Angelakisella sp.]|jgi:hypothetical protein|nr:hypothetical protein [Angelakisella sp.]